MGSKSTTGGRGMPDGAQMLLLAGFVISATAIMAIGAYSALQSGSTQLEERSNRPLVDLFLNTRSRAVNFFGMVTSNDTALSVQENLDGYLFSQYQTARSLSLEMNASLAGADAQAPLNESAAFTSDLDGDGTREYVDRRGNLLWSHRGGECFGGTEYDGDNDGLVTADDDRVLGAIFWLKVEGVDAELQEYVIIDVPDTDAVAACESWPGAWGNASTDPGDYSVSLNDVDQTDLGPYAVGDGGDLLERQGSQWARIDDNGPSGDGQNLHGADATTDGDELWIVGASGTVGEYDPGTDTMSDHTGLNDSYTDQLTDVAVTGHSGEARVYAADSSGHVQISSDDGGSWTDVTPGSGSSIEGIDFYDTESGVAVDTNQAVWETTDGGSTWSKIGISDTSENFHDVDANAAYDIWVAASGGKVYHFDGGSWTETVVDGTDSLNAIEIEDGAGHAVGDQGDIYHYDGSWTEETTQSESMRGTEIGSKAYAVGDNGTILETD
jgi:photosystem II stability/assembly factor-like uncharacterized protein